MSDKIADNPSFKNIEEQLTGLGCMSRLIPWKFTKEQLQCIKEMRKDFDSMRIIPDRFNALYMNLGWVYYGGINADILRECIALGENGELDKGEETLINFYNGDIRHLVFPLRNLAGFKERYTLFEKALDDYRDKRYHSCIPIFLMIIDGAVNQVLKKNQGLFAQDVDLTLYDSEVGHKYGLMSLVKILSKNRKKTTIDPIYVPYRNGIMHGMDVCYDNVLVATKALSTLFAVAEWIRHCLDDKHKAPQLDTSIDFDIICQEVKESCEKSKRLAVAKQLLNQWAPRDFSKTDFSSYGISDDSPEQRALQFMDLYSHRNYGKMAEMLIDYSGKSVSVMAGKIRSLINNIQCLDYQIIDIVDNSPAISEIIFVVKLSINDSIRSVEVKIRLIYQTDRTNTNVLVRGEPGGEWYIIDSVLSDIFCKANFNDH